MTEGPTDKEIADFLRLARTYAKTASKDEDVIEGAANHAVMQLKRYWASVDAHEGSRRAWLKVVAVNAARKSGADLAKNVPFGRAGSEFPDSDDPEADERALRLIGEMHLGGGSLGSFVAGRVDFERRWALLSASHRSLLHDKYVEGHRSKKIAKRRGRGESEEQINHKLADARAAARLVLEDLLG